MEEQQLSFRAERPEDIEAYLRSINQRRHPLGLLLDKINDTQNLGSLFRLADAARLEHIWLYGNDRLVDSKKLRRVGRSSHLYVPHSLIGRDELLQLSSRYQMIGLEITNRSIPYPAFLPSLPSILVIGNEKDGLSEELLTLCRQCIHVPMFGVNTSMNVAMATGIAVYGLLEKAGFLQ